MDRETSEKIKAQQKEIKALRKEVRRLRTALAETSGSVRDMLSRRGFRIYKKGRARGVILPDPSGVGELDEFYRRMKRYSFRLFLRDVIKHKHGFKPDDLVRYSSLRAVEGFCGYLRDAGIIAFESGVRYALTAAEEVRSFGPTLEWFVSEVFRREYMADTVWGVKFKDTLSGGDYDVIAAVEGSLVYAEVKSSPPKQIYVNEVGAFIDRVSELGPDLSLFIVDTELRMKDKIVELFREAMPGGPLAGKRIERFKDELFRVGSRMFIVNSKGGLHTNIGEVMGRYLRRS